MSGIVVSCCTTVNRLDVLHQHTHDEYAHDVNLESGLFASLFGSSVECSGSESRWRRGGT